MNDHDLMAGDDVTPEASILLVSCYELGHQPLGIASVCGFLRRAGYTCETMDIAVEPFDVHKAARAQIVGISVPMHTALRLGIAVAQRLRQINPTCHICFFGLYAQLNADYLLDHIADSVIGGEFEEPFVALVDALVRQRKKRGRSRHPWWQSQRAPDIPGVSFPGRKTGPVLWRLPFAVPHREGLPSLTRYAHVEIGGARRLVGYVEASRGCLHHCVHCPIPPVYGGRFFVVPQQVVLEDIRQLVEAGAQHITFGDPDFLNGPGHALRVVRAMHRAFPELTFDFTAKVEHLLARRECLFELAELGCLFIISAVESLSDVVLANLNKGHTRADVYAALDLVRRAGVAWRPTWIPFTPWATLDDYIDILEFVHSEGLVYHVDPVQYTIRLLVPPGSMLLGRAAIQPFLGPLDETGFTYQWTHPDPRMDELHRRVSALVERAGRAHEDPAQTFHEIRRLAYEMRDGEPPELAPPPLLDRAERPPRLTEPWFC